ncbi:hypothetical protein Tco_0436782 [Tanacetum coccineum]
MSRIPSFAIMLVGVAVATQGCHGSETVLPDVSHRPSFVIMLVSAAVASQGDNPSVSVTHYLAWLPLCLWKMVTSDSWLTIRKGSFKELHNTTDLAEEKLRYISRIASYLSKVENFGKLEMKGFEFFGPGDIHLFPVSVKTKFALGLKENIAEGSKQLKGLARLLTENPVEHLGAIGVAKMYKGKLSKQNKSHKVLGIALVAIIDRQLPFEYTIASRSTDVMVPVPLAPPANSAAQVLAEWNAVYDVYNEELKSMFEKQAGVERFNLIQTFHACKQEEGKPVGPYVIKMKGYVEQLKHLGYVLSQDLSVGLILNGLTSDFAGFVRHYKRNYLVYLAELMKKKKQVGTTSSSGERKMKQEALYLYVGNGVHAQVEAIGSFGLILPNGLVICLDNCHYAPTITRGVVSVSRLVDNGFIQCFTDYGISVSKNDVLYLNAIPHDGIYEIDMLNLVPKC